MNILDEIKQGESKTIEFKEQMPKNDSIAKTVIAFANTAGGRLVIGVNDSLKIVGIAEESIFQTQEKISSIIHDLCYPNIIPEVYTVQVDSKILLVVEIFRGNLLPYWFKPKGLQEGTYIRIGSSNRAADEVLIMDLQRQRMHRSFDEEANLEYTLDDLELDIVYNAFSKIGKICDREKLKNLKLITRFNETFFPSNALMIVLGRLDNVQIKCARFKGTTMESFIDKKEFEGTLFHMLEKSMEFLQNHLHLSATIEGLQRTEHYEIPLVAMREIILNAIIHRDYTRNSDIKIAIYDDIVEIISVGGFVNGLTIDDIGNGRSELRNKVLANLFRELGYIESWGSGIGRVRTMCLEAGVDFELTEQGTFVQAHFIRPKKTEKVSPIANLKQETAEKLPNNAKNDRIRPNTTEYDRKVIEYIKKNNAVNRSEAKVLLGIGETKIKEIFNTLIEKGLIMRVGAGRSTHYILREHFGREED